jgi:pyridinium-3,5-biscarboxylic acid mononucleotide sulfurtransferase
LNVSSLPEKQTRLRDLLVDLDSVLVGYSGGVDSVLLARVAVDVLGTERVLAVTGRSDSLASWMGETAARVARDFGIPWLEVDTAEMADPRYTANPSNRCYFCKTELWARLRGVADEHGLRHVVDGANADDASDYRPGAAAAREHGVRSPMQEAGLSKADIRAWSKQLGLPTWDQPAAPCLSSRIPYGIAVTPDRLRAVEAAELALQRLGFREVRVRHHGDLARVEVGAQERDGVLRDPTAVAAAVRSAGFTEVAVDIEGYRTGALNEALTELVQLRIDRAPPGAATAELPPGVALRSGGLGGDVAVLAGPAIETERLIGAASAGLADALKARGFRWVAVDLPVA